MTARYNGHIDAHRCTDSIRFIAHRLHTHHFGTNKVDAFLSYQRRKIWRFGQKANSGMQRVYLLRFCNIQNAQRI